MKEEEILAGNKLIADVMERSVSIIHNELCYADWDGMHSVKYHESWDWQIPVWSKIAYLIKEVVLIHKPSKENGGFYLDLLDRYNDSVFMNNPLKGFREIVEAITWYNQNK